MNGEHLESILADRKRLLRIGIYLKVYVVLFVLLGYAILELLGLLKYLNFPKRSLGGLILIYIFLSAIYLYVSQRPRRLYFLYFLVAITDIIFFTFIIHYLGGADLPVACSDLQWSDG